MVEGDLFQVNDIMWRDFRKLLWSDVGLSFIKFDYNAYSGLIGLVTLQYRSASCG